MDVEQLIHEVFVRIPLWDQKNKNHHNRFVLDKLWDEVARKLNTSRLSARNKWKALRDKFRTTLKSGDLSMNSYEGQWKYFKILSFLKDQFTPKVAGENFSVNEFEILNETSQNVDEEESKLSIPIIGTVSPQHCNEPISPSSSRPSSSTGSRLNISSKRKHPSNEDTGAALLQREMNKMSYLEEAAEDDDLMFFKSLLPHVKTLSIYDKMSYRMAVLKVTQDFLP